MSGGRMRIFSICLATRLKVILLHIRFFLVIEIKWTGNMPALTHKFRLSVFDIDASSFPLLHYNTFIIEELGRG